MIREILTLVVDKLPVSYYIEFKKDRRHFKFQPTLKNKSAPSFTISVNSHELSIDPPIDESIVFQAKEKVKEILANSIFDKI